MRPKSEPKHPQRELFQSELEQIIDLNHPLVRLAGLLRPREQQGLNPV